jgi:hypothetical protein
MNHIISIFFLILSINIACAQENKYRIIPANEVIAENVYNNLNKIYNQDRNEFESFPNYRLPWKQLENISRKSIKKCFKQISNNFTINFNKNLIETKTEFSLGQDVRSFLSFGINGHTLYDDNGEGLRLSQHFDISNYNSEIDSLTNNFNSTIVNLIHLNDNHKYIHGDLWIETRLVRTFEYVTVSKSDTGKTFSYGKNKFKLLSFENGIATFRVFENELNFRFIITNNQENVIFTENYRQPLMKNMFDYFVDSNMSLSKEEFVKKYAELTSGLRLDDKSLNEILIISCGKLDYKIHFYKPVDYNTIISKISLE